MFGKTVVSTVVALGLALQVSAHAAVNPPLGVTSGTAARSDVQRPNNNCGSINVAATIDTSKAIPVAADGTFAATGVDFNAGGDGSRSFAASVDATGAGTTFVPATVTKNGDAAPAAVGSDQLTVALPAGTKCTGGATKDKCVVSFVSTAGFGNCVVVQQAAAAAAPPPPAASSAAPAAASSASAAAASAPPAAVSAANAAAQSAAAAAEATAVPGTAAPIAAAAAAAAAAGAPAAAAAAGGKKHHKGGKKAKAAAAAAAAAAAKPKGRSVVRRRLADME